MPSLLTQTDINSNTVRINVPHQHVSWQKMTYPSQVQDLFSFKTTGSCQNKTIQLTGYSDQSGPYIMPAVVRDLVGTSVDTPCIGLSKTEVRIAKPEKKLTKRVARLARLEARTQPRAKRIKRLKKRIARLETRLVKLRARLAAE